MWYSRDDLSSARRELGLVQGKGSQPIFNGDQVRSVNQMKQKTACFECSVSENDVNSTDYILSVCRDLCCDVISLYTFGHRTWTCIRLMASSADPAAAAKG